MLVVLVVVVFSIEVFVAGSLALLQRKVWADCWFFGLGWRLVAELEVAEVQQAKQRKNS
ncbi:MAG: hypothetical protein ACE14S_09070 [Candidatus Bathyarchaeia archaeon]